MLAVRDIHPPLVAGDLSPVSLSPWYSAHPRLSPAVVLQGVVLVLTKTDLVPAPQLHAWTHYYQR